MAPRTHLGYPHEGPLVAGGVAPEGEVAVEVEDSDVLKAALAPRVVRRRRPRAAAVSWWGFFQNPFLSSSLSCSGEVTVYTANNVTDSSTHPSRA